MRRVTVSIPTYDNADTLRRAVDSVLGQTMGDLSLVVTNDGGPLDALDCLADVDDPRLSIVTADHNAGRYACDLRALEASDSEWFTVCDADDWVEPDWLESMLSVADGAEVVIGGHHEHDANRNRSSLWQPRQFTGRFQWHAHMGACLYSTDWLRRSGALTDAVRVGHDNIVTGLPFLSASWTYAPKPTYHRVHRSGSLTSSSVTGVRSYMRRRTTEMLREVWSDLSSNPAESACIIGSMRHQRTGTQLVRDLPHTAWAMQPAALVELDAWLWEHSPRVIVECGSGLSTVILANYAAFTGAQVVSLDHDGRYAQATMSLLSHHGLAEGVELRVVPLVGSPPMYDTVLPRNIDFTLIDGPPESTGGREATLDALMPNMAPGWSAWLDDATRPLERAALQGWRTRHKVKVTQTNLPHSPVIVRPMVKRARKQDASDITLAILTGHRPQLLARTLASLPTWLLNTAHVVLLHDGGDEATVEVIDGYRDRIDRLISRRHPTQPMHTIGDNWSALAEHAETDLFLMLEDDWEFVGLGAQWLSDARSALTDGVAQVRLRSVSERTLGRHMTTRQPISWIPSPHGFIAEAHVTVNPNLMRSSDLGHLFPAEGELHMQRRAVNAGLTCIVQANPGAFMHIGDVSMREQLQPPR